MKLSSFLCKFGACAFLGLAGSAHGAVAVSQPLSWWANPSNSPQILEGKTFTFVACSLATAEPSRYLTVNTLDAFPGSLRVFLQSGQLPTSASLDYTLGVDTTALVYTGATLSYSNSIMPPTTITDYFSEEPSVVLANTTGGPVTVAIPGNHGVLHVHETMSGYWDTTTTMYSTATIPEPGTLAVLGLGVLLLRRRRG
jgi:hypothetical protein